MTQVANFHTTRIALFCFLYRDCKYGLFVFPHTSTQYVKCGSTSESYKLFNILMLTIDLTLLNIPAHLDTFIQTSTI